MGSNQKDIAFTHSEDEAVILVTGATGLVGGHLINELHRHGKKVKALYHATPPKKNLDGVKWIKGDILDMTSLEEAMQNADKVYHCAALVAYQANQKRLLHHINIEGTANVVNACLNARVKKLLHVSSVSAIGRSHSNDTLVNETMEWSEKTNQSEYGKSKHFAEMEIWRGIGEGLESVIVSPSIILGTADWHKGSSAIFKNVYHEFPWYTEGVMGFADVHDVVSAMILLMESDVHAQRFILSADNLTFKEVFIEIAKSFGKNPPYRKVTPFIAKAVWRLEALKSIFTGVQPLVTKETARAALAKVSFDNSKFLQYFPGFRYTHIKESIERICFELKELYNLP